MSLKRKSLILLRSTDTLRHPGARIQRIQLRSTIKRGHTQDTVSTKVHIPAYTITMIHKEKRQLRGAATERAYKRGKGGQCIPDTYN